MKKDFVNNALFNTFEMKNTMFTAITSLLKMKTCSTVLIQYLQSNE